MFDVTGGLERSRVFVVPAAYDGTNPAEVRILTIWIRLEKARSRASSESMYL